MPSQVRDAPPVRVAGPTAVSQAERINQIGIEPELQQFPRPAETRLRLPDDHSTGPKLLDPEMWNLQNRELRDE